MKTVVNYLIIGVIAVVVGFGFYKKIFVPKHTFAVLHPTTGQLKVTVRGIGRVNALNTYVITAHTGGKILQILTEEGQWVKKNDLLLVMDAVDLFQQMAMAKASLGKAENEVRALQGELNNRKAQKKLLQTTYQRIKKLYKKGVVSQQEYDKSAADLQGIRALLSVTASRIASSESVVEIAMKNIDALQEKINRLKIYSPIDGYVIARDAEVAQYVQPSFPILKIVDPETLEVEVKIDERISAVVKPLQPATIILRSKPDEHYKGVVKRIDAVTDAVTFERKVNVIFKTIPKPFFINEQARVTINIKQYDNVTKIPLAAVVQKRGKVGVWVVRNRRAHFVVLKKIAASIREMGVANLDADSAVIVPGRGRKFLREGMRIYR